MNANEKPAGTKHSKEAPCPLCGGTRFTWGEPVGRNQTRFRPAGSGAFGGGQPMEARKCDTCGNVQLFTRE